MTNLDCRISNPEPTLTADIEKWSTSLANIYSNLTKPIMDIILFSVKLAELVGWGGPGIVFLWYALCSAILKFISPPFGRLTAIL